MIRVLIQACLLTTVLHFTYANEKIVITGNDTMQFSTREFSVPAGKKVELEFKNVGKLPKIAMGHNLVILKEGVSALSFGAEGFASWWQCDQCASRVGYGGGPGAHKTFGTG